jgi:hypothetical protein
VGGSSSTSKTLTLDRDETRSQLDMTPSHHPRTSVQLYAAFSFTDHVMFRGGTTEHK